MTNRPAFREILDRVPVGGAGVRFEAILEVLGVILGLETDPKWTREDLKATHFGSRGTPKATLFGNVFCFLSQERPWSENEAKIVSKWS